jgi:hypothetical protein
VNYTLNYNYSFPIFTAKHHVYSLDKSLCDRLRARTVTVLIKLHVHTGSTCTSGQNQWLQVLSSPPRSVLRHKFPPSERVQTVHATAHVIFLLFRYINYTTSQLNNQRHLQWNQTHRDIWSFKAVKGHIMASCDEIVQCRKLWRMFQTNLLAADILSVTSQSKRIWTSSSVH